jgi:hypothetical protein
MGMFGVRAGAARFTWVSLVAGALGAAAGCGSDRSGFEEHGPNGPGGGGGAGDDPGAGTFGGDASAPVTPAGQNCKTAAQQKGYAGCDFVIAPPPYLMEMTRPPCFAAFLANNSPNPAKVKVSYGGAPNTNLAAFARLPNGSGDPATWPTLPATGIPPKGIAVVYLSDDPTSQHVSMGTPVRCPGDTVVHEPQGAAPPWPHRGKTFHIETDEPVTAYDMMPFGGAKSFIPSAELVLPTTTWGTNYVVAIPPLVLPAGTGGGPDEASWFQVVALQANTSVTIVGATDLEAPSMADAAGKNTPKTITLQAGEYIQYHAWRMAGQAEDISGTIVSSTAPVAIVGGDTALRIASQDSMKVPPFTGPDMTPKFCCVDSAHQQVPPISGLGFDYVAAPYATRRSDMAEESLVYRVVGVVDGTTLTYDPPVSSAPATLDRGKVVNFEARGAFRMTAQDKNHPFYVAQTMSYSTIGPDTRKDGDPKLPVHPAENGPRTLGDPEYVGVLPPAQFIKEYAFVTDPTFATTSLVVTRVKEGGAFADVSIDCIGNVTGWQPVGASGAYEWARVDLVRAGKGTGTCQNGAHTAKSAGPFGITVWGMDWWASYAYPAGGSAMKLNDVVVPPVPK